MSVTPDWVKHAVFYQIFPDRFARGKHSTTTHLRLQPWHSAPTQNGYQGGDLWGVIDAIESLQELGVTALYLTPIFQSASNHRYHTDDYYTIDPMLGGNAAFRALLSSLHDANIRLVLDGVFNHTGRGFFPFHDIIENGPHSPWVDWFHIAQWPIAPYHARKPANYRCWFHHRALPVLNHAHPAVREYLMQVGEYWLQQGVDGWRLDVPNEITTPGFWAEFRTRMKAVNADAYLTGEIMGDARAWLGGDQFDGVMNYLFRISTLRFASNGQVDSRYKKSICGARFTQLTAKGYAQRMAALLQLYPWELQLTQLNLLGSHDTVRIMTLLQQDREQVKLAVFLLLTFPGAPCIYYGDEVGLQGAKDPDCRRCFPPESEWDDDLYRFHQRLIRLRHAYPVLRTGVYQVLYAVGDTYIFARHLPQAWMICVVHRSAQACSVQLPIARLPEPYATVLGHAQVQVVFGSDTVVQKNDRLHMHLSAMSCLLINITTLKTVENT